MLTVKTLKTLSVALALATLMVTSFGGAAKAAPPGYYDRGYHVHEVEAARWHHVHPHYEPHVVYAPPAVVYAPPPPPQSSGLNLIIPLNFR